MGGAEGVAAGEDRARVRDGAAERVGAGERSRRIRALRPPKRKVDPAKPLGWVEEEERWPDGTTAPALTVFLAGAECPFTCVFCDLWRFTLDGRTPAGALPAQLRQALEEWTSGGGADPRGGRERRCTRLKLYNASNFFDPRAVPPEDLPELARLVEPFPHVTVENHPRLTDARCRDFQRLLTGRLEVALGLETIHPQALPRLEKRISVDDFDRSAERLLGWDLDLRVFVLVGTPFVPPAESLDWIVATVEHALKRGARLVALNPVRGGNGEMERLAATGEFTPPTLGDLEDALDACLDLPRAREAVVAADLWDVEVLVSCPECSEARVERLRRLNLTGRPEPRIECGVCA